MVFFGTYAMTNATSDPTDNKKIETEKTVVTDLETINVMENLDSSKEDAFCDIDCPSDDYCSGCLWSTYKTEYCVGQRCRTRTLYKCNVCSDTWWIYHD